MNHEISERIQQRMKELSLKGVDITNATGVSSGGVSQWVNGITKPTGTKLIDLANALETSPEWILTGKHPQNLAPISHNAEWIGDIDLWDSTTKLGADEVELPFFTEVELSAGSGMSEVRQNHGPKLRFSKSSLKRQGVDPANAACVKVAGDSMEPVLPDGSTVGIDTSSTNIIDGKMYAIDHDGLLRVKRLYRLPAGGIRINSFNKEEYPDESYSNQDTKSIKIIGKVFWYSALV